MKKETMKQVPIVLPDGVEVVVGMKVYEVKRYELGYSKKDGKYISKWTGVMSSYLVESTVVHLNMDAVSRTFVVRSDRGCEHTYSVKNSCLPQIFGKRESAVYHQKQITLEDVEKIKKKILAAHDRLKDQIKSHKETTQTYRKTVNDLKKLKY